MRGRLYPSFAELAILLTLALVAANHSRLRRRPANPDRLPFRAERPDPHRHGQSRTCGQAPARRDLHRLSERAADDGGPGFRPARRGDHQPAPAHRPVVKTARNDRVVAALGNSSHSLLVPKTSTATQFADLKGKKIGVSFSTDSHLDLVMTLKQQGLDPKSDVELINLPPNELPGALETALIDAALVRQPQVLRLIEGMGARAIHTWPFHFISIVRTEYLKKNPETIKRYLEALRASIFYAIRNPDESSRWFGEIQRVDPADRAQSIR